MSSRSSRASAETASASSTEDRNDLDTEDEFDEPEEKVSLPPSVSLSGTDWTTETIVSQLSKNNILLSPRFQRRDAWDIVRKSRFIESLIVGLPIPQIVLADSKQDRNKFIVLDGKQRLLTIKQFWGHGEGPNNGFALTDLTILTELEGSSYQDITTDPALEKFNNGLLNCPIRTVVLRGWRDVGFLHTVFLRLNTGSLPLSPQELRQAAFPGAFTDYADDFSSKSSELQKVLGISRPDYRMRDIELFARYVGFSLFLSTYAGRMKPFLDETFATLNAAWSKKQAKTAAAALNFEKTIKTLRKIFGDTGVARKPGGRQLNRAVFDALAIALKDKSTRVAAIAHKSDVQREVNILFKKKNFLAAIEKATADLPSTLLRLNDISTAIAKATHVILPTYKIVDTADGQRIRQR